MIIRNLEEFGPDYFVVAQVTGISANEYRRIQGSVRNHVLIQAGEEIPIQVENAQRLVTATDAFRREAGESPAPSTGTAEEAARGFAKAERALRTALAELDKLRIHAAGPGRPRAPPIRHRRIRTQAEVAGYAGKAIGRRSEREFSQNSRDSLEVCPTLIFHRRKTR